MLVEPAAGERIRSFQILVEANALLFTRWDREDESWADADVVVRRLDDGLEQVVATGADARYVRTGHLLFTRGGEVFAMPFDSTRLEASGAAVSVLGPVEHTNNATYFAVSESGSLVYIPGGRASTARRSLFWVDQDGNEQRLPVEPRQFASARVSPDGTRVALDVREESNDIWLLTLADHTLSRFTFHSNTDAEPIWIDDGQIVFESHRSGDANLFLKAVTGGVATRVTDAPRHQIPFDVSPDGRSVVFEDGNSPPNLSLVSLDDRSVRPLLSGPAPESRGSISPDGRWFAYQQVDGEQADVYVRHFPAMTDGLWQVTASGGTNPTWSGDGRELFYAAGDGWLVSIDVDTSAGFSAGPPRRITRLGPTGREKRFDVAPNGRFLIIRTDGRAAADEPYRGLGRIVLVQDWFEELRARVPTEQ